MCTIAVYTNKAVIKFLLLFAFYLMVFLVDPIKLYL